LSSSDLALAFVLTVVPLAIFSRWAVLRSRGTFDWDAQWPLGIAGLAIMLSAIVITMGGRVVQQIVPPLLITVSGVMLATRTRDDTRGYLRWIGLGAVLGGVLLLIRGMALAISAGA
jgi:hypothetical protein